MKGNSKTVAAVTRKFPGRGELLDKGGAESLATLPQNGESFSAAHLWAKGVIY